MARLFALGPRLPTGRSKAQRSRASRHGVHPPRVSEAAKSHWLLVSVAWRFKVRRGEERRRKTRLATDQAGEYSYSGRTGSADNDDITRRDKDKTLTHPGLAPAASVAGPQGGTATDGHQRPWGARSSIRRNRHLGASLRRQSAMEAPARGVWRMRRRRWRRGKSKVDAEKPAGGGGPSCASLRSVFVCASKCGGGRPLRQRLAS